MIFNSLNQWQMGFTKPVIIAGPCGVESEVQLHQTLSNFKGMGVQLVRGGIWKPRSRPGSFQGLGVEGLRIFKKVANHYNLPITVEVASGEHVSEALKHQVNVLWIGARTTVNPFAVQEIAEALQGEDIPVMVKNPVNPDLELWVGAIERIYQAGIQNIAAVHRGFSAYERSKYRNQPNWQIPIELKRRFPTLPLINDPSHIAGRRNLIAEVAQTAFDLDFDGLMVEVHPQPDQALSDAKQQLTPSDFGLLLNSLVVKQTQLDDVIFNTLLDELRNRIDQIDETILELISKRMELARQIGIYKKENGITILQVERWNKILATRIKSGALKELSESFIIESYKLIHDESIRQQSNVALSSKTI
ncbi:MAG: hypothetical protein RIQ89_1773 [Bacteroidota bacterium]|jgi:chorismate mutase